METESPVSCDRWQGPGSVLVATLVTAPSFKVRNKGGRADFGIEIAFSCKKLSNTEWRCLVGKWVLGTCLDWVCRFVSRRADAEWSLGGECVIQICHVELEKISED